MYKNVKPVMPLLYAWEFVPRPGRVGMAERDAKKSDWNSLYKIARQRHWTIDKGYLKEIYSHDTDAVIVTEANQQIVYVSHGFEKMTGYRPAETLGKWPVFLQGPGTEAVAKTQIRKALLASERVNVQITNYRKNGELYVCTIDIIPMFDVDHQVVNYLALEKELPLVKEDLYEAAML